MNPELKEMARKAGGDPPSRHDAYWAMPDAELTEFAALVAERCAEEMLNRGRYWRSMDTALSDSLRDEAQRCALQLRDLATRWRSFPPTRDTE